MTETDVPHDLADLRDLFENAPCGYLSADATGRILKANQTFSAWTGYKSDWLVGRRFQDLLNVVGKVYYETHFAPLLRMQGVFNEVALDLVRADGLNLPVLVNAIERQDGKQGARFVRIAVFKASDRRRYERELLAARRSADEASGALRELNETLEARVAERTRERDRAWRLSQDLLAVAETDGTLAAVNAAWTALLGWEERELVGSTFMVFTHPDDLGATLHAFAGIFDAPLTTPYEYRLRHKDGSYRSFAWTGAFDDGRVYAIGRHTTAEREQQEALRQAEEALRQAQKMEAVGQLTGGIAHDFNNLLQVIVGNLEILNRNLPADSPRLKRSAENAMNGARRAATLTQRLLAFSRRQPLAPRTVNVNKLIGGMSDLLVRTLGETTQLETVLAGGLWRIEADPHQLESAILNLALNARDAMPSGGKLTMETVNGHLDRDYAMKHAEVSPGQYVTICVSDTGFGMSRETLSRVFEPFFTTKEVGKGTGLGLAMVYGFIKQSGGHVKIYSEPGEGTTVRMYLPRVAAEPDDPAAVEERDLSPEGSQAETILVVEDDDDVRAYSVAALRELGYRVLEASDGPAALRVVEQEKNAIDLLFSDVVLPHGMSGADLAAAFRRLRLSAKVLFTTGYARNAIVHHGRLDAGVELITKPFTYAELAARVRDILDASAPESPIKQG